MADEPRAPAPPNRPALPWILFAVSTAVAVLATTGFVYLLNKRAVGPAEVLRDFYQAMHNGDCEATYALLDRTLTQTIERPEWCDALDEVDYPVGFTVESQILEEDIVTMLVREDGGASVTWVLARHARTWRIVSFPDERFPPVAGG